MDKESAIDALHSMDWHFAKSMPNIPHWYARRSEAPCAMTFLDVARYIKDNGDPERFYSKTYKYLRDDQFKYWIMDEDPSDAEIINRAKL